MAVRFGQVRNCRNEMGDAFREFAVYVDGEPTSLCYIHPAEGMTEWDPGTALRFRFGENALGGHRNARDLKKAILEAFEAEAQERKPKPGNYSTPKKRWTEAEDQELAAIAEKNLKHGRLRGWRESHHARLKAFALKTGRSYASVKMRASRLGASSYWTARTAPKPL